jgi:hypothetical protein
LRSSIQLEIFDARVEHVDADALLVPVDGQLCKLGGAAASALRAALPADERIDEMQYVEDELARLRPMRHPDSAAIDGVARWSKLVIAAAYPHNVDGAVFSAHDCAQMIRAALPVACDVAARVGVRALAATLIGTAYRMPADLAIRAFVDGLAAASASLTVCWSLPDPAHRDLAIGAWQRVR